MTVNLYIDPAYFMLVLCQRLVKDITPEAQNIEGLHGAELRALHTLAMLASDGPGAG